MERSIISFQINLAWFSTYNKIVDLQLDNVFEFKELDSPKEFPIQYLLYCKKEDAENIINGLKKISTISKRCSHRIYTGRSINSARR